MKTDKSYIVNTIIKTYNYQLLSNYPKIFNHIMKYINDRTETLMSKNVGKQLLYTVGNENDFYDCCGVDKGELVRIINECPNFPSKVISDQTDPLYNLIMAMICLYYRYRDSQYVIISRDKSKNIEKAFELLEIYLALRIYSKVQMFMFPNEPTGFNAEIMEYTINNLNNRFELASAPNIYSIIKRYGISNNSSLNIDLSVVPDESIFRYISKLKIRFKNFIFSIKSEFNKNKADRKASSVQQLEAKNSEGQMFLLVADNVSNNIDIVSKKVLNRFVQDRVLDKTILTTSCRKTNVSIETARIMIENIRDSRDEKLLVTIIGDVIGYWIVSKKQSITNIHSKAFAIACLKAYAISNTKDKFVIDLKEKLQEILNKYSEYYSSISRRATLSNFKQCVFYYLVLYTMKVA